MRVEEGGLVGDEGKAVPKRRITVRVVAVDKADCYVRQNIATSGKTYAYTTYMRADSGAPTMFVGGSVVTAYNVHTLTSSFAAYSGTYTANNTGFIIDNGPAGAANNSRTIYLDSVTLTAANILTGTGLDGAAPPAETQRWNPNLMGWYLQEMEQDIWGEAEQGNPPTVITLPYSDLVFSGFTVNGTIDTDFAGTASFAYQRGSGSILYTTPVTILPGLTAVSEVLSALSAGIYTYFLVFTIDSDEYIGEVASVILSNTGAAIGGRFGLGMGFGMG